jgi:hypothetical protein
MCAFNMAASALNFMVNTSIEQFNTCVDQTTTEVVNARSKFERRGELVDAFNGDAIAAGFVAAEAKADKLKGRLITAQINRQNAAYQRYLVALESTNITIIAKGTMPSNAGGSKVDDTKLLKGS